jgi:hypothetical protein
VYGSVLNLFYDGTVLCMTEQPLSPRISDDDEQDDEQEEGGYSSLDEDSSGEDEDVYDLFTQARFHSYTACSAHALCSCITTCSVHTVVLLHTIRQSICAALGIMFATHATAQHELHALQKCRTVPATEL